MVQGKVEIFRYDPENARQYYATYSFPFASGMTVLDVLLHVRDHNDSTLSFSYCCRNGHCGLCGVIVNGVPGLACHELAGPELTIEPLDKRAVVRDLIIDPCVYQEKVGKLNLYLCREQSDKLALPEYIKPADFELLKVVSRCVACKCCDAACPLKKEDNSFLGPSGFVLLARHIFDPRDELDRGHLLTNGNIKTCISCGCCSNVCPQNIDPQGIIQKMR